MGTKRKAGSDGGAMNGDFDAYGQSALYIVCFLYAFRVSFAMYR